MAKTLAETKPATSTTRRNRDANVIAAAISVMSERGYPATSIQEVADRVGVLKGSLYHYFSSKEELLFRILDESHQQNAEVVARVSALNLSAFEELLEYLRQSSMWYLANVERANIYFSESRHLTGDRLVESQKKSRDYERYIQNLVMVAQEDGDIRVDIEYRLISRYVLGSINNIRSSPSRSGKVYSSQAIVDAFIAMTRSAIQSPN
jgi:AcrR family transcriptional regulator